MDNMDAENNVHNKDHGYKEENSQPSKVQLKRNETKQKQNNNAQPSRVRSNKDKKNNRNEVHGHSKVHGHIKDHGHINNNGHNKDHGHQGSWS